MSLWVDEYRPKSLEELTYNSELTKRLKILVRIVDNKEYVINVIKVVKVIKSHKYTCKIILGVFGRFPPLAHIRSSRCRKKDAYFLSFKRVIR